MERILSQKEYSQYLEKYVSSEVSICDTSLSLQRVAVKLYRADIEDVLYVIMPSCTYISSPLSWKGGRLTLKSICDEEEAKVMLIDECFNYFIKSRGGIIMCLNNKYAEEFKFDESTLLAYEQEKDRKKIGKMDES